MVWGCFSHAGVGQLKTIEGIMKKQQYQCILQRHAIPSGINLIGRRFIFQQDNDPKIHKNFVLFIWNEKKSQVILI